MILDVLSCFNKYDLTFDRCNNFPHFLVFTFLCCDSTENEQGIFEQVLHGDLDFASDPWPSISDGAKDLVRRMLVRDPKRRMTAHEVLCESLSMFKKNNNYIFFQDC